MYPPLHQNHIYTDLLPFLTGTVSQSYLRYRLPSCSPHFAQFSLVQSLSCVWLFATSWTVVHQASLSITNSQSSLKLMSIESVIPSNHLILCRPLLLLPSIFPSIRVSFNESVLCIRWPKCCHQIKFNSQLSPCAIILSQQKL